MSTRAVKLTFYLWPSSSQILCTLYKPLRYLPHLRILRNSLRESLRRLPQLRILGDPLRESLGGLEQLAIISI
jgi:hypothetical protein